MTCPCCDGPAKILGQLGRATWYRCCSCGAQWSTFEREKKS